MASNIVVCKCTKCGARLGVMANFWFQIGRKYMMPMALADDDEPWAIASAGAIRCGDAGSVVGGCQLQDAECARCRTNLGQKCLQCPVNHVLNDGQLIFRNTSISLVSSTDLGRTAEPNIQRVLKLKMLSASRGDKAATSDPGGPVEDEAGARHSSDSSSLDYMRLQAQLDVQHESIAQIGSSGVHAVSSFEAAISRMDAHIQRLSDSICSVRADGEGQRVALDAFKAEVTDANWRHQDDDDDNDDGGGVVVAHLCQRLQATDRVLAELRQAMYQSQTETEALREQVALAQQELQKVSNETAALGNKVGTEQAAHENTAASREYACEVSVLRRQVKQPRAQLAQKRERVQSQAVGPPSISAHELDILTSSISKIGNRASQVDSLQMELDLFRSRLQRIESRANAPGAHLSRGSGATATEASAGSDGETRVRYGACDAREKRTLNRRDDSHDPETTTPPKRVPMSPSDLDSGISIGCSRASDVCTSLPKKWDDKSTTQLPAPPGKHRRTRHGTTRDSGRQLWDDGSHGEASITMKEERIGGEAFQRRRMSSGFRMEALFEHGGP